MDKVYFTVNYSPKKLAYDLCVFDAQDGDADYFVMRTKEERGSHYSSLDKNKVECLIDFLQRILDKDK